jgi:hypothetical protein
MTLKDLFKGSTRSVEPGPSIVVPRAVTVRIPSLGDPVWWAPKCAGCTVTRVQTDGLITFQGGETIKNKKGRQVPRWTVQSLVKNFVWRDDLKMWIVGAGPHPKTLRGQVVYPEPARLSGQAQGSFAVTGG